MEEVVKRASSEPEKEKSVETRKPNSNSKILTILFAIILTFCVAPALFLFYMYTQHIKQVSEQTKAVYEEYHALSLKASDLATEASAFTVSESNAQQKSEAIIAQANDLQKEITAAKERAAKNTQNLFKSNEAAYAQLENGVTAAKEYTTFTLCTANNSQYEKAMKAVKDNMRTYGIAQGDGNYSPEITRQQKVKNGLNTIKSLNSKYLSCVASNPKFVTVITKDNKEIDRYFREFFNPFISVLKSGDQGKIQTFMNNIVPKSWLSIGWRLAIEKNGDFSKSIQENKNILVNLPSDIQLTDAALLKKLR